MNKNVGLLELASNLSGFGNPGIIGKVFNICKCVMNKNLSSGASKDEFKRMINLYYYQTDILGGGEREKREFKVFVNDWMGIRCHKEGTVTWQKEELRSLEFDELFFVLGWARRIAKEKHYENGKYGKQLFTENDAGNNHSSNVSMEKMLKDLQKKYNSR